MLRTDYIFSIWIFIWFIVYALNLTKYNPTFALLFAVFFINISMIYFIRNKIDNYHIYRFIIICAIEKFLPLAYIYYTEDLNVDIDDVVFTVLLFIAYNINLLINDTDLYRVYKQYINSYLYDDENKMYYTQLYDETYKYFYNIKNTHQTSFN